MTKTFFLSKRYYPLFWTLMHIHVLNCHCFSMAFYWKVLPKWDIKMCVFMVSLNTFHLSPLDQAKIWLKPNLIFSILHVYTEKHLPLFYSLSFCPQCQRSNLTLGKFQCLIISLLNTTVWVNSKQGKTVCKCTRAKITRSENNPTYSR